jgi:serine protease
VIFKRFIASIVALAVCVPAFSSELRYAEFPIEGEYIVVLKDAGDFPASMRARGTDVPAVASDMARQHRVDVSQTWEHALRGFLTRAPERAALQRLLNDPRVAYVEENGEVFLTATQSNATWGIDRIDQRDRPLSGTYTYNTTASNVRSYIIDTGIRSSHNEFSGRMLSGYTSISDGNGTNDCNGHGTHVAGTVGGTVYGVAKETRLVPVRVLNCQGSGTNDCNGHGTHVAGTVGGTVYGVAKETRLVPVRVLNCQGSGTNAGVIAGIDWVTANHVKPAVANMSLGGGASSATDTAVNNLINAGVTVVVAAGNDNRDACNYSPARVANAITVGSTTSSDARSSFSNFGSCVNIFAPGSSITAAWSTSNTATNTISGTSMASPHVAGVAALYLADNPSATPATVRNAIYSNGSTGKLSSIGSGSPNLLVYSLFGDGGGGDPPPSNDELTNGQSVGSLSGAQGSERRWFTNVPSGATNLVIKISGGSGDADLYVRRGSEPTTSSYDCRPYLNGNNETCTFASPQSGTWHIMIRGYTSYSGVTLQVSWDEPSSDPCTGCTKYSGSLSGTGASQVQPNGTYYYSGAGTHQGWLEGPANADFDLELYRWNGSSWSRVARSINSNSSEHITYNGTAGYYYWRILSYSGSGSYDFWLKRP